jgi:tetratricopeptide (TPR) repeat protein
MAGRTEEALAECERTIELNPNFAAGYAELGRNLAANGQRQEAIEACLTALRLNPRDPTNWERHSSMAIAYFLAGDDEAAAREARIAVQARPELPEPLIILAAATAAQGKNGEARSTAAQCVARWPDIRLGNIMPVCVPQFTRPADHARLLEMLRRAGFAE